MHGPHRPKFAPAASFVLSVRITHALGQALETRAAAENLTAASIIRRALVLALDGDNIHTIPIRRYRPSNPAPSIEVQEIARLREVVGEAVGTLRQVAGIDRARSGTRLAEIDCAISDLIAAAERLDVLKVLHEANRD